MARGKLVYKVDHPAAKGRGNDRDGNRIGLPIYNSGEDLFGYGGPHKPRLGANRFSLCPPMELTANPAHSASVKTIIAVLDCFTLGRGCLDREAFVPSRRFESAI